ncbi:uncharacterized protein [Drosophila bipectinata]|uniref:uncharacterized protein n=1 Tax=Drosophila bipectinata TaxID=42026 RepID=UPI001C89C2C2|nr:uncharacterized protein LOC108119087 [Drosophila bipectinata]
MKLVLLTLFGYLLLGAALSQASIAPATTGVIPTIPAAIPAGVPLATSHQFVTRNWNRFYVSTPPVATYPTYYKYSGGYPVYPTASYPSYPYGSTYQYTYPYGYYSTYPNYGYGYKSVW